MTKKYVATLIGVMALLLIVSGCITTRQTMTQKNWGTSFESAKHNQILNPEAEKNMAPVVGLAGEAAERTMQQYNTSFSGEPSKEVYNLSLGTISGIGEQK